MLDNARLTTQVEASIGELRDPRARIATAADRERRRIERDLHDGVQQRLVGVLIELGLVADVLGRDPQHGLERLHGLGTQVEETIDEIRSLARGVYPSALVDHGLVTALRAAALRTSLTTSVRGDGVGRHPPAIESPVYFSVLEALQNAAKHAAGARSVTVSLHEDRDLRFTVAYYGVGFDPRTIAPGAGLDEHARPTGVDRRRTADRIRPRGGLESSLGTCHWADAALHRRSSGCGRPRGQMTGQPPEPGCSRRVRAGSCGRAT